MSVTRATYRSPRRMLRTPMMAPITSATRPPATTAARTGHPWWLASWAVVSAPTPAKVIWHSQSIPPSPVTRVHERKITPKAKAWAVRPDPVPAEDERQCSGEQR